MQFRRIGTSQLNVSEIAFGTGDNAGSMIYARAADQIAIIERALEFGINLFDTSPDYGKGLGEANLGRALRELSAREAHIITKVEIMPEDFGRIRDKVRESVNDSLLRLQRDCVDVVMLHNPVRPERDLGIRQWCRLTPADVMGEVLPALESVQAAGKARYLGLATEAADPQSVRALLATGKFAVINAWFNLANPSAAVRVSGIPATENYEGLFATAKEFGVGVVVIRPLAGGALTSDIVCRGHAGRHALSRGYFRDLPQVFEPEMIRAHHFRFLDRPGERTLAQAAMRFVLECPAVSSVVGGFSQISHMADAVACTREPRLSPSDVEAINAVFQKGF